MQLWDRDMVSDIQMAKTHSSEWKERGASLTIMTFGESTIFAITSKKKRKEENSGYINASAKKDTLNKDKWIFIQNNSHLPDHTQRDRILFQHIMSFRVNQYWWQFIPIWQPYTEASFFEIFIISP